MLKLNPLIFNVLDQIVKHSIKLNRQKIWRIINFAFLSSNAVFKENNSINIQYLL